MEKIEPGKYVELVYDLYEISEDGEQKLVHQVDPDDPEKIVAGITQGVILPLEKALNGLAAGDSYNVFVNAEEAFGPHDPEQVVELERDIFNIDGKFDEEAVTVGATIPMMTQDGFRIWGVVKEVGPEKVKMDFNHPLAGKNVRFIGSVKTVREATAEELQPVHGCGCGCHGDGCDDHCGCDDHDHSHCGEGCGC